MSKTKIQNGVFFAHPLSGKLPKHDYGMYLVLTTWANLFFLATWIYVNIQYITS